MSTMAASDGGEEKNQGAATLWFTVVGTDHRIIWHAVKANRESSLCGISRPLNRRGADEIGTRGVPCRVCIERTKRKGAAS